MDQAIGLCYVAKKYILPDLVAKCLQFVHKHLCPEYTCRLLEFSKLIDDEHLTVIFKHVIFVRFIYFYILH